MVWPAAALAPGARWRAILVMETGVAYQRIHGTAGERPLDRFESVEAGALLVLNAKLPNLAEQEFSRRVGKDC